MQIIAVKLITGDSCQIHKIYSVVIVHVHKQMGERVNISPHHKLYRGRTPILRKKQQNKALFLENKALFLENKALFLKNKALLRIKVWVNFIFIFQNLLLNHFYCMLFSSWVLVFPLMICFII